MDTDGGGEIDLEEFKVVRFDHPSENKTLDLSINNSSFYECIYNLQFLWFILCLSTSGSFVRKDDEIGAHDAWWSSSQGAALFVLTWKYCVIIALLIGLYLFKRFILLFIYFIQIDVLKQQEDKKRALNVKKQQKLKKQSQIYKENLLQLRRDNNRHTLKIFLDAVGARRSLYGVTLKTYMDVFEAIDQDDVRYSWST